MGVSADLKSKGDAGEPLVLNAEDLTVGRRLDVVAVSGAKTYEWRSLMNRLVSYPEAPDYIRQRLRDLAGDDALGHDADGGPIARDESSFQLLSRAMPMVGSSVP